jgi:hypothetical protein
MRNVHLGGAALVVLASLVQAPPLRAQIYETVGIRAQGMGGAFVAVADDATATWWNPAGLATGPVVGMVFEQTRTIDPANDPQGPPAWKAPTMGFALAFPALGVSYYRVRVGEIQRFVPTVSNGDGREVETSASVGIRTMALSQYGATVGQSLGGYLTIGSTLKLVRGGQVVVTEASGSDLLDQALDLEVPMATHTDLDVGAMATLSRLRLGVSVKHLREPAFGEGENRIQLTRQARAGAAVLGGPFGPIDSATAAVDFDLLDTPTATGIARYVAIGGEAVLFRRIVGVRGGMSTNRGGDDPTRSTSLGLSVGMQGLYFDSAFVFGSDKSREGWGVGARLTF